MDRAPTTPRPVMRRDLATNLLAPLAAAATGIFVGSTIVVTRFVIDQTHPFSLAFMRYVIGLLCLAPVLLTIRRVPFARRDLLPIALLGITQFGILIALLNFGLLYIPSAIGALIFATFPMLTMVLAAILRYEQITVPKAVGVLLTFAGVGLALGEQLGLPSSTENGLIGELAVLGSALSGAVCAVLYRPYLQRYPTVQVSAFAMLASVAFLAVPAAYEGLFSALPRFSAAGWAAIGFIGVSSGVGYYLWLWALGHTTPTRVAVFLALSPITATALGALWLGEVIGVLFLGGLFSLALGLWLAHRQ